MGVLSQAVTGVLPRGNIRVFFNMYKNCNTYQQNEIDIKLRETTLCNVKSLEIPLSVTGKKNYKYDPKLTWKWVQIQPDLIDRYFSKTLYFWEQILDIQR